MCVLICGRQSTADGEHNITKKLRAYEKKDQIEFAHALNECKYSRDEFIV